MPFKVIIASVLKPVDDTRMFEKLGVSINNIPEFDANIVGFSGKSAKVPKQYPIFRFKRNSFLRILAPLKFLRFLYVQKPQIIIAETYELLFPSIIYNFFEGECEIIYDIRENYKLNAKNSPVGNRLPKWFTSKVIKMVEHFSSNFINQFFIAEEIYKEQLSFLDGKNVTLLENRASKNQKIKMQRNTNQILFTGTLGFQTCVLECIELVENLNKQNSLIKLTIIGYSSDTNFYNILKEKVSEKPFINLIGGNVLVPHQEILVNLRTAGIGFIGYKEEPHIVNKIPTKYYEYVENELPIILYKTKWLKARVQNSGAGTCIDSVEDIGWYRDFDTKFSEATKSKEKTWDYYDATIKEVLLRLVK